MILAVDFRGGGQPRRAARTGAPGPGAGLGPDLDPDYPPTYDDATVGTGSSVTEEFRPGRSRRRDR